MSTARAAQAARAVAPALASLSRAQRWAITIAPLAIRALYTTWRVHVTGDAGWRRLRAEQRPFVFALWHGQLLPLLAQHRGEGTRVLISEHRDGEIIARIAHAIGLGTIRGSTTRGAARALLAMCDALEHGQEIAVTPDGPRGPAHTFAPGTLVAAQRAGAPIVPIGVAASRAWRLRSWDAFMIPKPFARVEIVYGEPRSVAAGDARGAAAEAPVFAAMMDALVARAERTQQ